MVGFQLPDSHKEIAKNLMCGGAAGGLGIFIGQPFDFIKIQLQTQPKLYPSALACFINVVRKDGFLSLYRGLTAPFVGQFLQNALIFAGEGVALRYLEPDIKFQKEMSSKTVMNVFLAGSFGGLLQCLVLVPADLIKCKLQVDRIDGKPAYTGNMDCIKKVYRTEGLKGFYKGFGVTALREVPAFGVYFFVYRYSLRLMNNTTNTTSTTTSSSSSSSSSSPDTSLTLPSPHAQCDSKDAIDHYNPPPSTSSSSTSHHHHHHHHSPEHDLTTMTAGGLVGTVASSNSPHLETDVGDDDSGPGISTMIAGGLAGCASWLLIYPVDVVKSYVQTGGGGGNNSNAYEVTKYLYRKHGLGVFTKGLGVTMLRAFPVNAAVFYTLETLKHRFGLD